jgi:hypothetical protein
MFMRCKSGRPEGGAVPGQRGARVAQEDEEVMSQILQSGGQDGAVMSRPGQSGQGCGAVPTTCSHPGRR